TVILRTARAHCFNGAAVSQRRSAGAAAAATAGAALQWGRRLSTAECLPSVLTVTLNLPTLQWGRRLSTAECPRCACRRSVKSLLQWGRRLSRAECVVRRAARLAVVMLQWGRRLSTAECPMTAHLSGTNSCFNGAAVSQRRSVHFVD